MNIEKLYKLYSTSYLVDTDTRKIRENSIFFALKGTKFNGNKFAENALNLGAKYAIIDEKKYKTKSSIFLVDNVLETLQQLANYHRKKLGIPIIALTGSNGKTTTKELINISLRQKFCTTATLGNLNNHIGVPLTLLSMDKNTELGIVEMGANHQKEIQFLCSICEPDFGYITNFGKAHLEGFGGEEGVIKGKSELYDFLRIHKKTAFVNNKDVIQLQKTKNINRILFSTHLKFLETNPFVKLWYKNREIQTNLLGQYNYNNIAAAITIAEYFNIDTAKIQVALEQYEPKNNRSQIIKTENNTIILDAYNANPSSMKVALESFSTYNSPQKTIILGDMFELGENSAKEHQTIVNFAESLHFDTYFFIGEHFFKTKTKYKKYKNFDDAKIEISALNLQGNSILIKGSRGMALERLVEVIK